MPQFRVSSVSIVNQIKNNLQDRYESGFPVLKELLQNADDSRATRFRLEALPGWRDAENPLLRWPGLLAVNDGQFCKKDEEGILSLGDSNKASDRTVIGKFGFGQKAVFHLCDAFVVYAYGLDTTFSTVVNPFLGVPVGGNVSHTWEPVSDGSLVPADLEKLNLAVAEDFRDRALLLWFPLRREELSPAPGIGFSTNNPRLSETVSDLIRREDLALILSTLRHLERIEIKQDGQDHCTLRLDRDSGRLLGPVVWPDGVRQFGGRISVQSSQAVRKFVGREATLSKGRMEHLKSSSFWPRTVSVDTARPEPEKGEPHGAVTVMRAPTSKPAKIRMSWGVFLPISDVHDVEIPLDDSALGQVRILFHGYFFLDSGRRSIEGLTDAWTGGDPADAAGLRRAWNAELRDTVVLPLVPTILQDALDSGVVNSVDLEALARSVARHSWFRTNRRAVCKEHALVRVLKTSESPVWRTEPAEAVLRPLPQAVATTPSRIAELFPGIFDWASTRHVMLCVDPDASLTAAPMHWIPEDLDTLFASLSRRAFQAGALAPLLADFLALIEPDDAKREAIGPHIVAALRQAMGQSNQMAPSRHLAQLLAHVPQALLFPLPASVEHRRVLRMLADAPTSVLPVRRAWLGDVPHRVRLPTADLKVLLEALDAHMAGAQADQAAVAALACLVNAEQGLAELAHSPDLAPLKVVNARDVRAGTLAPISLGLLLERSRAHLLFASSPDANRLLPLVVKALPGAAPLIVEQPAADFLRESGGSVLSARNANKLAVFALIRAAVRFGPEQARARLISALQPAAEDDRNALRRLCAGAVEAGSKDADLSILDDGHSGIERIVTHLVTKSATGFLVPLGIANELTPRLRSWLGIAILDTAAIQMLLNENIDEISRLEPTPAECEAFLCTQLPQSFLRQLPIHLRSDGTVGNAANAFAEADFAVPASLRARVLTIRLHDDSPLRRRQQAILTPWTPENQLEVASAMPDPHRFRSEILDALAALPSDDGNLEPEIRTMLVTKRWLVADDRPVAPQDVLSLPTPVDEAARALLVKSGEAPPFEPAGRLAIDIRQHPGFAHLRERILPDQRSSFAALALLVEETGVIGRLGPANAGLIEDLTVLALEGHDPGLPGWKLVSALLSALRDDPPQSLEFITAFAALDIDHTDLTARVLDRFASLAGDRGRSGEAARRLYLRGFEVVAQWPEKLRRRVFAHVSVPTRDGGWRTGNAVAEDGNGISPAHLLATECALILRKGVGGLSQSLEVPINELTGTHEIHGTANIETVDMPKLEADAAAQQRCFLQSWRGRVPADLVITYLGLIGRDPFIKALADEWWAEATSDVDTLWEELDNHFPRSVLFTNPLLVEIDERRYLIKPVSGNTVRVLALSGGLFEAPLGATGDGIVIGNLHKTHQGIRGADKTVRRLITLPLRAVDLGGLGQHEACALFRRFIETIATDCLWLRMGTQRVALEKILDKAQTIDQATLAESEYLLRDRLPAILAELKLPTADRAQEALRDYQYGESRLLRLSPSEEKMNELKLDLWTAVSDPETASELLSAVRARIMEYGYSPARVLFEIFQNADDAYRQLDVPVEDACFRVELIRDGAGGFQVIHWGRPINHLGRDPEDGRRLGHGRDLLNMLLMNFSEKRPENDLTGKFGLGFKSVHVLSDSVGIASGFITLRTAGGFLPKSWPEGMALIEQYRSRDGRKATIIDVPFSDATSPKGMKAIGAFRDAMLWLPVFARAIHRLQLVNSNTVTVECTASELLDESAIQVISISGHDRRRALRFDLVDGFRLLIAIDAAGPNAFPPELGRLWNLAPLEEDMQSGWLLNGPFVVDPGRGRIAGTVADRQRIFVRLGRSLGERLLRLHDLSLSDWPGFAAALDLDTWAEVASALFWSRLFDLLEVDLGNDFARHLHADGHGYARLASERPVVPTRLPPPFDGLVRASDARHFTSGALADRSVLEAVQGWPILCGLSCLIVAQGVAEQLNKLGFKNIRALTLAELVRREMGEDRRIDPSLSARLGRLISPEAIEKEPLHQERRPLLDVASQSLFLAKDGAWRHVRDLNSAAVGGSDEKRLCKFAPDSALLSDRYDDPALEFFRVARSQSGYGPRPALLLDWAHGAVSPARRRAVLRYIIEGSQGRALADSMRANFPSWIPRPIVTLLGDPLLADWPDEERKRLIFELGGHYLFVIASGSTTTVGPDGNSETVLAAIHAWWSTNGPAVRADYATRVYPSGFSPSQLRGSDDRTAWFTMFALGCFQSIGRTQDGQHRGYIERGQREGWWPYLARSRPPEDVQSWLERLEHWSAAEQLDQDFLPWRRLFVDLYSVARWLEEYIEILRNLPRIVEEHGVISLNDILRPSYSPAIRSLSLDAAPLARSLGIGINWMVRELLRYEFYDSSDERLVIPYSWASTARVRNLLTRLGADAGGIADMDASRVMHEFVVESIGPERVRFDGDFDLPLHQITRERFHPVLQICFANAGYELPDLEPTHSDYSDETPDSIE